MTMRFSLIVLVLLVGTSFAASNPLLLSQELDATYCYEGSATTMAGDRHVGSLTEHYADLKYVVSPQVGQKLLWRFGAEWQRFSFGVPDGVSLPKTLQQISAIIGCDYQLADQWLLRVEVQPGVYSDFEQVNWHSVDVPVIVGAAYLHNADLQWFFGVLMDPRCEYPLLPSVGVRWKFADQWTLNLQMPTPRLEYEATDNLKVYLGLGIKVGTFVVNNHFGTDHGLPQLNGATVDYYEARFGPGVSWKVLPNVTLEMEGGFVLGRWWDFYDARLQFASRQAPYVQIACHARF